jgi:hypothetical protein
MRESDRLAATVLSSTAATVYYHDFDALPSERLPDLALSLSAAHGAVVSHTHSVVKLAADAFASPAAYLRGTVDTSAAVRVLLAAWASGAAGSGIDPRVAAQVAVSGALDVLWPAALNSSALPLANATLWLLAGTEAGVTRVFPGVTLPRAYDARTQSWYARAGACAGCLAVTPATSDPVSAASVRLVAWHVPDGCSLTRAVGRLCT